MNKYDYTGKGRAELNAQYFKEMYPKDLTLSQVLVFHRHGERTPIARRFPEISPKYWDFCRHANLFHEQFRNRLRAEIDSNSPGSTTPLDLSHRNSDSNVSDEYWKIKRKGRIFPDKATPPPDEQKKKDEKKMEGGGGSINKVIHEESEEEYFSRANMNSCGWGQLSDVGWKSMYEVGNYLRTVYVEKLGILPKNRSELGSSDLYVRSTDYSRALESVHQVVTGLYPVSGENAGDKGGESERIKVRVRPSKEETLYLNFNCKAMGDMLGKMITFVSKHHFSQEIDNELEVLYKVNEIGDDVKAVMRNKYYLAPMHVIFDTLVSMKAHNVTVPKEIVSDEQEYIRNNKNAMDNNEPPMKEEDVVNVKKLGDLAAKQWVYGGLISPKLARLQATPLLLEIIENLTSSVTNSPQEENNKDGENKTTTSEARKHWPYKLPHKLSIFSGHDTTLSVLLAAMNAYKIYDPQNPNGNNINKEGYFDGHKLFWPGFGDYMSLELFKDNGTKPSNTDNAKSSAEEWPSVIPKDINTNGYYVRVLYNGNPVVLPKCTPKGQHHDAMGPSMCTLSAFFNQLGPVTTTYTDWSAECIRPVTDQDLPPIS